MGQVEEWIGTCGAVLAMLQLRGSRPVLHEQRHGIETLPVLVCVISEYRVHQCTPRVAARAETCSRGNAA